MYSTTYNKLSPLEGLQRASLVVQRRKICEKFLHILQGKGRSKGYGPINVNIIMTQY